MLNLTRKENQVIVIDNNIFIKILKITGKNVKISVDAPRNISVHRLEIQKKIDQERNNVLLIDL